ncbi:MAG TPA: DUF72 domain-containing protein [Candidatus Thermoplasmatota archaeon]|nr:DUF72 domain-containing protein [Candidatus Thermoplasmatota archaeon]
MIRVGVSGWSYEEWVGPFYPVHLRGRSSEWLAHYATRFRTVEINSTFYAFPGEDLVAGWARAGVALQETGPFEFSLKLPRDVTHRALADGDHDAARETTGRFDREVLDPLAGEGLLGAVLVQLPPRLGPTPEAVRGVQEVLSALAERRVALEFRHRGWFERNCVVPEAERLFASPDVCLAEVDSPLGQDAAPPVDARHAYLRLHGRREAYWTGPLARADAQDGARYDYLYDLEELRPVAERVAALDAARKEVRVYFNNTPGAKAPANALDLMRLLGMAPTVPRPRLTEQRRLEV